MAEVEPIPAEPITTEAEAAEARKAWIERSNAEKAASINNSQRAIIAMGLKAEKAIWEKDISNEELDRTQPYNCLTGNTAYGKDEILMRTMSELKGYETNQFVEFKQAARLGAEIKEGEIGIRIGTKKDVEYVPAVNEKTGELIINKEKPTWKDKDGAEHPNYVMQRKPLEKPIVDSLTYFNIAQLKNPEVLKEHMVERDMSKLNAMREKINETGIMPKIHKTLEPLNLHNKTARSIEHYLINRAKGKDHEALHRKVENENEKTQTQEKPKAKEKKGMER